MGRGYELFVFLARGFHGLEKLGDTIAGQAGHAY